jgi:hypothetical protein
MALCGVLVPLFAGPVVAEERVSEPVADPSLGYNEVVRPILAENCFACHGPDSASRKAGLRLDVREEAIAMGAIVPGEPEASELVDRIRRGADDDLAMPPIDGHKRLDERDKGLLVAWIAAGAEYQPHWSFIPPTRPAPPEVAQADWVRNPIDRFVLARLESLGLPPAAEADRRTLARRLSLDLTGLPPTPEQVERFVADPDPDYYEKYVDALLNSSRWGEHRGRYWLDYARYADTHGIHFDNYREIWSYRDWVISAFNRNLPFDQFSIEQLAGDLLPDPTLDQLIATGFNRCNITTNEGGIIDEEYKVLYARDRTETTSAVWLGLTTGCAVCHDHKFDPVSMRDFYSLSAFFNNTTQPVRDGNVADTPPIIPVPRVEDRARWDALPAEIAAAAKERDRVRREARGAFDAQVAELAADDVVTAMRREDLLLHAPLAEGAGNTLQLWAEGGLRPSVARGPLRWNEGHTSEKAVEVSADAELALPRAGDFERDQAFTLASWVWLPGENLGGAIVGRMNEANDYRGWDVWLEGGRLGSHVIHRWPENALKVVCQQPLPSQRWVHVAVVYDGSSRQEGLQFYIDGQRCATRQVQQNSLSESIRTEVPLKLGSRSQGAKIAGMRLNDLRIYGAELAAEEVATLSVASRAGYLAAISPETRTAGQTDALFAWWLGEHSAEYAAADRRHAALQRERESIRQRGTIAHIMRERDGAAVAHMLDRGEYDKRLEEVTAATPSALPPMDESLPANRLGLAKWLFSAQHPLTARVTVNRFWQEVFGRGFVGTAGDFGVMGSLPTHPELLDYLAVEFRESGWDVKQLFRLIVTSATYRQAAEVSPQKRELDPQNLYYSRGPRFRMDAEMVRDYALRVSGLLAGEIGGPSVRPYQPPGVWEAVAMPGSNTRNYQRDDGDALYRRSMYTFWKRSAPPASMDILNAPSREVCTVRRERTNTPLQALVTLNDPQFIEAARVLAADVLSTTSDDQLRIDTLGRRLLARPFDPREVEVIRDSLDRLRDHYTETTEDAEQLLAIGASAPPAELPAGELAAWTMLCNQLMNLDEVLNK